MKRTLSLALVLGLITASAFAAEVTSVNTVGYKAVDIQTGLTMYGVSFEDIGSDGTVNIQNAVKTDGLVGYDWTLFAEGDKLYIWDASAQGYVNIYLWSGTGVPGFAGASDNEWMDGAFNTANIDLPLGSAFWIESSTATPAASTVLGQVSPDASTVLSFSPGLTMMSNPFPYALDINAPAYTGLVGYDWTLFAEGDKLYVWDPVLQGYTTIVLWSGTGVPGFAGASDNEWMDGGFNTASLTIPVGGAFWVETSGAGGTMTVDAP